MKTVYRVVVPFAILILATTTGLTMSVMTNATGPYNYSCDEFRAVKPAERKLALAFAQGYFAALNMQREVGSQVNLQERWKELNARIEYLCNDEIQPLPLPSVRRGFCRAGTRRDGEKPPAVGTQDRFNRRNHFGRHLDLRDARF